MLISVQQRQRLIHALLSVLLLDRDNAEQQCFVRRQLLKVRGFLVTVRPLRRPVRGCSPIITCSRTQKVSLRSESISLQVCLCGGSVCVQTAPVAEWWYLTSQQRTVGRSSMRGLAKPRSPSSLDFTLNRGCILMQTIIRRRGERRVCSVLPTRQPFASKFATV